MTRMAIKGNRFYDPFDCEFLEPRKGEDYRTPFQRDRDRIIHSSALRRLQAKTQVFLAGEYDFYRTRLTHSIEVAQIGRSICYYLVQQSDLLEADYYIDPDLVEAVCLAHDLGHPPFGHAGEEILHQCMREFGGFEGNAQTLRTLTEVIYSDGPRREGMKPTRALIDGVMKYKTLMRLYESPRRHFLYDDQQPYLDFIFEGRPVPPEFTSGDALNRFRSVECQIMDWADDTAYSLNDIIDCIHARFITRERLENWGQENHPDPEEANFLVGIIEALQHNDIERVFSRKIGDFIGGCRLATRQNFMSDRTRRYGYELIIDPAILKEANFYKRIALEIVFNSPQLQQFIHKWHHILGKLFQAFQENYTGTPRQRWKLLPEVTHRQVLSVPDTQQRMRMICDHIAGMTDRFAIRTYNRLFNPAAGSIADLIS